MKLVREHINEKFTEEGDPIRQMSIGGVQVLKKIKEEVDKVTGWEEIYFDESELCLQYDSYYNLCLNEYEASKYDWASIGITYAFDIYDYYDISIDKNAVTRSLRVENSDIPDLDYWYNKIILYNISSKTPLEIANLISVELGKFDFSEVMEEAWEIAEIEYEKTQKRISD